MAKGNRGRPSTPRGGSNDRGRGGRGGRGFRGGRGRGGRGGWGGGAPFLIDSTAYIEELDFSVVDIDSPAPPDRGRGGNPRGGFGGDSGRGGREGQRGAATPRGGRGERGGRGGRGGWGGGGQSQAGSSYATSIHQDDLALLSGQFASNPSSTYASRGGAPGRGRGGPPTSYEPTHRRTSGIGVSPQAKSGSSSTYRPVDANGTLSSLLYRERPLLRPVVFVPSVYSRVLFTYEEQEAEEQAEAERKARAEKQEEEEVREMLAGELGEENPEEYNLHAPTADRVMRVFSGSLIAPPEPLPPLPDIGSIARAAASIYDDDEDDAEASFASGYGDEDEDTIEEIDFSDMGRLMASLDEAASSKPVKARNARGEGEERFTGFFTPPMAETNTSGAEAGMDVDEVVGKAESSGEVQVEVATTTTVVATTTATATPAAQLSLDAEKKEREGQGEDTSDPLFIIDTDPTIPTSHHTSLEKPRISAPLPVRLDPEDDDGDEVIVYVAPHPRRAQEPTSPSGGSEGVGVKAVEKVAFEPYTSVLGSSGAAAAAPSTPSASTAAVTTSVVVDTMMGTPAATPATTKRLAVPPVSTPRMAKAESVKQRKVAKRQILLQQRSKKTVLFDRTFGRGGAGGLRGGRKPSGGLGALGALMQERELRDEYGDGEGDGVDQRWSERRRGDSDLEWGDEDDEDDEETPTNAGKSKNGGEDEDEYMTFHELTKAQGPGEAEEDETADAEANDGEGSFKLHTPSPSSLSRDRKRHNRRFRRKSNNTSVLSAALRNEALESAMDMDIDPELSTEKDMEAMKKFAQGMLGQDAGAHVTMGDLEDAEKMRVEDEGASEGEESRGESGDSDSDSESDSGSDSEFAQNEEDEQVGKELDQAVELEEELMLAEDAMSALSVNDDDEDDEDEDEEDDEKTPRSKFTARLEKLRESSLKHKAAGADKGKGKAKMVYDDEDEFADDMDFDEDEDEDDLLMRNMKWAEKNDEEELVAVIQELLDENEDILKGRDRKSRNKLFKAISNGDFDDYDDDDDDDDAYDDFFFKPAKRGKKAKRAGIPLALQDQWDKDRQAKALRKQQRQLEKLVRAADPFQSHKGGKKARKAMLAAAKLDPTIMVLPNRIIDISTLVQMLHKFVNDLGGKKQLSLPPTDKKTRKTVHELAIAFGLESFSKGKEGSRYITVVKTTRCGPGRVDERMVARIVKRFGGPGARGNDFTSGSRGGGGGGRGGWVPKHKEGDEVGKAAPKIDATNVGFRMLAMMGWSEGERIGTVGEGLDVPLTAIIKHSKLGLGATR